MAVYKEGMDQWLLAVTSDPAAKGSAKDLEVAMLVRFTAIPPPPLLSLPCVLPNVVFHETRLAHLETREYATQHAVTLNASYALEVLTGLTGHLLSGNVFLAVGSVSAGILADGGGCGRVEGSWG